jgi:hypothetical protein
MRSVVKRPAAAAGAFAAGLTALMAAGPEAAAQSFFQQLFGFGTPAPGPTPPPAPSTPGGRSYSFPSGNISPRRPSTDDDDERSNRGSGSGYKTVCVRMCDGYYFPVSNNTGKKGFYRDQMKCRSSCGDEARLFHMPANATDISEATDGQGRIYGLLPAAYKYRKTLVAGCQCKPEPWSDAELARHQRYAEIDAEKAAAEQAQATKIAAAQTKADTKVASAAQPAPPAPAAGVTTADAAGGPATIAAAVVKADPRKSKTTRTASPASPPQRRAPAPNVAQAPKPFSPAMGLGGGQFSWPGDKPKP